jgi:O-antigen/teichoic acid export membrane protein
MEKHTVLASNGYKNYIKDLNLVALIRNQIVGQTSILFSSGVLLIGITILTGILNTRFLGPEGYGIYSFVLAIISFLSIFFGFGFGSAGARLVALAPNEEREREVLGGSIFIGICISFLLSVTIFISSFFTDWIFKTNINRLLVLLSVIGGVLQLQLMIGQACQGANRILELAVFNLLPKLWYLVALTIVVLAYDLNAFLALFLNFGSILIACLIMIPRLKPTFKNLNHSLKSLQKETKEYGFHVYIGSIADTSSYRLDNLFIASFVNTTSVGFYTLATTLTSPISTLSRSLSISLFKDFTKTKKIDKKVILFNLIWLAICIMFLVVAGKVIVVTFFSGKFLPVVPLILPLALAGFFQGMYQPFNMFLNAKGKGRELKQAALVEALFNVISNLVLIYLYGAMGAAISSATAKAIELAFNIYFYKQATKEPASY